LVTIAAGTLVIAVTATDRTPKAASFVAERTPYSLLLLLPLLLPRSFAGCVGLRAFLVRIGAVVPSALRRIAEHVVGNVDELHPLVGPSLGVRVGRVQVRMGDADEAFVGALDLLVRCSRGDAQNFIVILKLHPDLRLGTVKASSKV
jgi:hypothetical protein